MIGGKTLLSSKLGTATARIVDSGESRSLVCESLVDSSAAGAVRLNERSVSRMAVDASTAFAGIVRTGTSAVRIRINEISVEVPVADQQVWLALFRGELLTETPIVEWLDEHGDRVFSADPRWRSNSRALRSEEVEIALTGIADFRRSNLPVCLACGSSNWRVTEVAGSGVDDGATAFCNECGIHSDARYVMYAPASE